MSDDEYQRTAKALARETRMSDASAARIEQKLLSAIENREVAVSHSRLWLPAGRKLVAAAALIAVVAGGITLRKITSSNNTTTDKQIVFQKPATAADIVLPLPPKPAVVISEKTGRGNRRAHRAQTAHVVRPNGFVELPWTADLPAFESGEIVRVEVPVASLPAYGFDISRGATRSVEADVLVGQDGLARAMRLVTTSVRSTQ